MNPVHDVFPDNLMVGSAASNGGDFLVVVTAGPDSRCIIRRITYKPDVVVAGGGTRFSCIGHVGQVGAGAGGIKVSASIHPAALHGLGHGIG